MGKKPSLLEHIQQKTGNPIETPEHARALVPHVVQLGALQTFDDDAIEAAADLLDAMQRVTSAEAAAVLRQEALPALIDLYDRARVIVDQDARSAWSPQLLFFLKIFALYGGEASLQRIVAAARAGLQAEGFLWSTIFGELSDAPAEAHQLLAALGDPMVPGFIAVALLDLANTMWRAAPDEPHAFDTSTGRAHLAAWLASEDAEEFSYALSATVALAGMTGQEATALLLLADGHPDLFVKMEAAWVRGRRGDESAIAQLAAWAADPRTGRRAVEYLRELGRLESVPPVVNSLDYFALAEMAAWLSHPLEFGRPPDELAVLDHRRIHWPPTRDDRDLWLVRYRYAGAADDGAQDDVGVGCVGSVTFALFGEATEKLDPDDLYGLYCCWELEQAGDERAPRHRSALAGRKLLGFKKKR